MAAVGHAILPVTVSIKGITGQLNKELSQPAQAAAKRASDNINKTLKAGVEDAAKAVESARKREERATQSVISAEKALKSARDTAEQKAKAVESAELKLQSARSGAQVKVAEAEQRLAKLRDSGKASADQITIAESKLEQARSQQGAKVIDAENRLAAARQGAKAAADSVAGAEEKVISKKKQAADAAEQVISATKRLDSAQDASAGSSSRFAGAMERVRESAKRTGSAVAEAAEKYKVQAGIVVGAVGVLAKGAMDYAAEAEQSYGAVEAVFAEHAQGIIDHSKDAAEAVGVSGREYRELSAYMGAMLKNLGLPMDEVAAKTEDLVGVGADLAATFGGTTKDAVEAIGAVMRGETDPIERYGVSIKEADIKAKAAAMGLGDLEGAAGKQAKAQAILALLTEQTSAAQGQFGRETDTAAHKQQVATAKLNDAKEAIGTGLLPVYAAFMDKLAGVSRLIGDHPKLFVALGGAVAGLAGAVMTLGAVAPIFTAISAAASAAGVSMWGYVSAQVAAIAPIAAVAAAVAAIGVALWAFFTKTEAGKRIWDALVDAFKAGVGWIRDVFVGAWHLLVEAMQPVVDFFGQVGDAAKGVWDIFAHGDFTGGIFGIEEDSALVDFLFDVREAAEGIYNILFKGDFTGQFLGLEEDSAFVDFLFDIRENVLLVWDAIKAAPSAIWEGMKSAWEAIAPVLQWVADIVWGSLKGAFESLWEALGAVVGAVKDAGGALGGALFSSMQAIFEVAKGLWSALKDLWDVLSPLLVPVLKIIGALVGGVLIGAFLGLVKGVELVAKVVSVAAKAFSWLISNAIVPLIGWAGQLVKWLGEKLGGVFSFVGTAAKWLADSLVWTWEKIQQGWDWLSNAISVAWETVIKPVFNAIGEAAKMLFAVVATALISPFLILWNLLSATIKAAWEYVIQPVWNAIASVATWLWTTILSPVFGWIGTAWNFLSEEMKRGWEEYIKPAWDAVSAAAMWLWNNALMPVFGWIQSGWTLLVNGIKWAWENVLKPTWDFVSMAANWLWNGVLMPVFSWIQSGWQMLVDSIKWVWENILKPTWDTLGNSLRWLNDNVIQPILQWIQDRWQQMADGIKWVRDNVIQPVFDAIGTGLDTLKGWFETAVDAIGRTWNRVKELTAKPIKFVVDTVFNNGIRKAWNAVVGFIGMDDKKMNPVELGELGKYATGGVLPGYTPGRDVHNFVSPTGGRLMLSGGEAIMRPEWTRAVGGPKAVEQMNRAARSGKMKMPDEKQLKENEKLAQSHAAGGIFQAFANGGVVAAMTRIVQQKYPMIQMTSGYRNTPDNHGRGLAGDFSNGFGNTPEMIALANDIANTYPGSMELIHEYPGFNRQIKNGQFVGGGGGSWGFYAGAGDHANHVHWAMNTPPTIPFGGGVFKGGSGGEGSGGGFFDFVGQMVKPAWDAIIDKIPKYEGSKGTFAETPAAFLKTGAGLVWDFVKEKAASFGGGGSSAGVDTSGVSGPVVAQVEEIFKRHGWTGQQWEDAKWIIGKESGWNPSAVNPSSGAYGLFQFLGATKQTYLPGPDYSVPTQANAGARYMKDRYGSPTAARRFWEANNWYDSGGYLQPGVTVTHNETGKPEPVFTAEQWAVLRGNILTNAQAQNWHAVVDDLKVIAGGIQTAIGLVDWEKVNSQIGSEFGSSFAEGQMKDIQSVFGLPDYDSIPLVKFQKEWEDAVKKQTDEAAKAAEDATKTADSTTRTADAAEKIAGEANESTKDNTSKPVGESPSPKPADSAAATATNFGGGFFAAAGAAAQAAGVPGAAQVGSTVQIVTADMAGAMQRFRTMQAQGAAGMIGV